MLTYQIRQFEYFLGRRNVERINLEETVVFRDIIIKTINQLKFYLQEEYGYSINKIFYNKNYSKKIVINTDKVKLNQKAGFVYKVLCQKNDLERFSGKIIIIDRNSDSTIISASEETIADIKKFFRVEQILSGVSKVTNNQIVQFNTPVLQRLKQRIEDTGAKILQPLSRYEIVVSIPSEDIVNQIRNFEEVVQVTPYVPKIRV